MSYDSESGSTSSGDTDGGRGGRAYAGPLVFVRRGSSGKFPEGLSLEYKVKWKESEITDQLYSSIPQEDGVIGLLDDQFHALF